ncbi:outer membrane beta-barrel protein [Pseudemcibacter aquimaris]|uniref:outer membrane beta-barrel protein n=1 Tax=Pseudemcibacter aquimaris TaxID=2857064 RepID=UPI002012371D|nr:outer membrane beta-barrel protein [Pseudemcibacter aquimaris]MCC3859601.1 porin family protein [Pseudemcibacter aquimaris]WDU59997.1 porin family protein [Pseudemcibacter aquimaris]
MKLRTYIIGLFLALGVTLPALAQNSDYEGLYGGIRAGIGKINDSGTLNNRLFDNSDEYGVAGVLVGSRMRFSNTVIVGAELDANYYSSVNDFRLGASVIAGFEFRDTDLLFGRIGYTSLQRSGGADNLSGLLFGVGYEHILSENVNIRLEYQNFSYDDARISADDITAYSGNEISAAAIFKF